MFFKAFGISGVYFMFFSKMILHVEHKGSQVFMASIFFDVEVDHFIL